MALGAGLPIRNLKRPEDVVDIGSGTTRLRAVLSMGRIIDGDYSQDGGETFQ